jgi:riboflavin synthase
MRARSPCTAGQRSELVYNLAVFTGLVQTTGRLAELRSRPSSRILVVEGELDERDVAVGASVAVSGVCLTVLGSDRGRIEFEAAFETLSCTTLGSKRVGDRLNLEPSLRMGDPLGGHLVSGHVDGVGRLRSTTPRGAALELWFDLDAPLRRYVAAKGSVAIDGVSLTVNRVDARGFMVGIIPHTSSVTSIGDLAVGDGANVEVDLLARYVARLLEDRGLVDGSAGSLTVQALVDGGFVRTEDPR